MALRSTQPLTEKSTRLFPGGKGGRCVRLTNLPPSCSVVMKYGNLNFLEPSGPPQTRNGTALPYMSTDETSVFWDVMPRWRVNSYHPTWHNISEDWDLWSIFIFCLRWTAVISLILVNSCRIYWFMCVYCQMSHRGHLKFGAIYPTPRVVASTASLKNYYRGSDKSLARPTSRCIFLIVIIFLLMLVLLYIYIYIYIYY